MSSITPQVGGETSQRFYPPGSGRHTVVEKLDLVNNQAFATFQQVLPPRCRLLAAEVKAITDAAFTGSVAASTSTANAYAVVAASNLAAFTALASNATASNSFLIRSVTNTSAGTITRAFQGTNVPATLIDNTTTDYKYLYLLPVADSGTRSVSLDGTNVTSTVASSYRFNGTQQVAVRLEFEQYGGLD